MLNYYDDYLVSEKIEIKSEWRCFVYKNVLVKTTNYLGDPWLKPNTKLVLSMIKDYSTSAPAAYTLDVGVGPNGTFVIEVHNFIACNLLGMKNTSKLPEMMIAAYKYEIENTQIEKHKLFA